MYRRCFPSPQITKQATSMTSESSVGMVKRLTIAQHLFAPCLPAVYMMQITNKRNVPLQNDQMIQANVSVSY